MTDEIALQLDTAVTFRVVVYDPDTGDEIAADSPPTLQIFDKSGISVFGPTGSTLVSGTTGTYDITVNLLASWGDGEFVFQWVWSVQTGAWDFKPWDTFHGKVKPGATG